MKGFLKFCGTVISICLLLGIVLIGIGIIQGGLPETLSKIANGDYSFTEDTFKPVIDFFCQGEEDDWNSNAFNKNYPVIKDASETKEYELTNTKELVLDLGGVNVVMEEADVSACVVEFAEIQKYQAYEEEGILYIKAINSNVVGKIKGKLHIKIPKDKSWEAVTLSAGAGTFELSNITCNDFKVEIGAGTLNINDVNCGELECQLGAGSVEFTDTVVKKDAKFDAGAGQTKFTGKLGGDLKAVCAAGEMIITLKDTVEEEHNYKLICAAGSLKAGSMELGGLAGEKKVDNDASTTYDITSTAGSFVLKFE